MDNYGLVINGFAFIFLSIYLLIMVIFGEKAAILIRVYSEIPKNARDGYDKKKLIGDYVLNLFISIICVGIGMAVSYFISSKAGVALFIIWLILYLIMNIIYKRNFNKYRFK
ncbi:DUF3784 domain-containing protein [Anaerosphaera multitolerans]|uniref:DUF3784 domain-containing protein n=1 Tax=Anaerosphaera multitolerans TaxID=2487351 RepID=A0A437S6A0_9FIRM|nr:DUF3784 domain-containing protein [Anaerosphaera multitolerans]RVU54507.1 hypothetical protein EF514_07055 [Anaerosphaera multitolerans]